MISINGDRIFSKFFISIVQNNRYELNSLHCNSQNMIEFFENLEGTYWVYIILVKYQLLPDSIFAPIQAKEVVAYVMKLLRL